MRSLAVAPALLLLVGCGGSARAEVHYDAKTATQCILDGGESSIAPQTLGERPGSFELEFAESLTGYAGFVLVVGYGPDHTTASIREERAREALPEQMLGDLAWDRREGNVVYEAFGPVTAEGLEQHLPRRVTIHDVQREVERVSSEMREAFADCLTKARRD